jgi:predicted P-loop ATPase
MSKPRNDTHRLKISSGQGNLGRVKNADMSWRHLKDQLRVPTTDASITFGGYMELPKEGPGGQDDRKQRPGFLVGGPCENGKRDLAHMGKRYLLALDIDEATAEQMKWFMKRKSPIWDYEFFAHTTRKHCQQKPRWRFLFPITRPVGFDEFNAVQRIIASNMFKTVEGSMDAVDDVSFRVAQIMYLPSISKGQDFEIIENPGKLISPKDVLKNFDGDWTDFTQLPHSITRGAKKPTDPGAKAENPLEKRGLIGAFCRTYSIEAAIEKFLPHIYTPGDEASFKPRYTYLGGTTSNGAIVEDDGLFLYSHHGSDPCGERLVNAFDMVRLHLYGDKDSKAREGTTMTKLPSYAAMEDSVENDKEVRAELVAGNYDTGAMFDDLDDGDDDETVEAPKKKKKDKTAKIVVTDTGAGFRDLDAGTEAEDVDKKATAATAYDFLKNLDESEKGIVAGSVTNLAIILQYDPRFTGCFQHNEFTKEDVCRRPIRSKAAPISRRVVADKVNGDIVSDLDEAELRVILEAPRTGGAGGGGYGYGLSVTQRNLTDAIRVAAQKQKFHPIRDFLEAAEWDGKKRLDTVFIDYLGCADNAYTRAASAMTLLAAVTRIFEPGHKFDFCTVLESPQGHRKSTFIETLANGWFGELSGNVHKRQEMVESMQGVWIMEIPELQGFSRSDVNDIKAFMSAKSDKTRLAYDRRAQVFKRQTIMIATTNDDTYLRDQTGNRRFWPIEVTVAQINIKKLKKNLPQIFAEATAVYHAMREKQPHGTLPLFLSDEAANTEAEARQADRRVEGLEDTFAQEVLEWVQRPVTRRDVEEGLGGGFADLDRADAGDTTLGLRTVFTAKQAWTDALGRPGHLYDQKAQMLMGLALKQLDIVSKPKLRTVHGARQRYYYRVGCEYDDIWVELPEGHEEVAR